MTLGAGGSWRDVCRKVQADFWTTLAAELAVWIPIQVGMGCADGVRWGGGGCAAYVVLVPVV